MTRALQLLGVAPAASYYAFVGVNQAGLGLKGHHSSEPSTVAGVEVVAVMRLEGPD